MTFWEPIYWVLEGILIVLVVWILTRKPRDVRSQRQDEVIKQMPLRGEEFRD